MATNRRATGTRHEMKFVVAGAALPDLVRRDCMETDHTARRKAKVVAPLVKTAHALFLFHQCAFLGDVDGPVDRTARSPRSAKSAVSMTLL